MERRTLDLNLISAKQLKNISPFGRMDVYAVVSISGTVEKLRTPVIKGGGPNPTWKSPMKLTFDEAAAMHYGLKLVIKIKAIGMFTNWKLGQVKVPIKELMESVKSDGILTQFVSYRLRRPSGKTTKGEVRFSYKFGEKFSANAFNPPPPPHRHRTYSQSIKGFVNGLLEAISLYIISTSIPSILNFTNPVAMECRSLFLNLISAKELKNISLFLFGRMDVYAVVSISDTVEKLRTPVNKGGGRNPTWKSPMKLTFDEAAAMHYGLKLVIKIKAIGMFTNWKLGEVQVPIKELMESVKFDGNPMQFVSYRLRRSSGKTTKGEVCFGYKFGEKFPPPPQGGYGYASYPPSPPPAAQVYVGYPYPPQQRPTDIGSGIEFGTGLLGGMLIGSMLSDGGDCDDAF
ncbi:hypothetical protein OSB04_010824 [Centaurea solstitialis]|uniref:C2 domain-containing protein n=1 Tax=Centaurea solstitialis TaxID=347529 RepID=A0AA38TK13_9ASTR|nr:hypothetical protein OSB04_010824 [Centaurea solstitialis]